MQIAQTYKLTNTYTLTGTLMLTLSVLILLSIALLNIFIVIVIIIIFVIIIVFIIDIHLLTNIVIFPIHFLFGVSCIDLLGQSWYVSLDVTTWRSKLAIIFIFNSWVLRQQLRVKIWLWSVPVLMIYLDHYCRVNKIIKYLM